MVSLDSCFLIDVLAGDPDAAQKALELDQRAEPKYVTAPAAAEVLWGGYRLGGTYLERTRKLIDSLALLPFDREAYHEVAQLGASLLARGTPVGQGDLFIAAISKRHGEPVLTRDETLSRIPGLAVVTY